MGVTGKRSLFNPLIVLFTLALRSTLMSLLKVLPCMYFMMHDFEFSSLPKSLLKELPSMKQTLGSERIRIENLFFLHSQIVVMLIFAKTLV